MWVRAQRKPSLKGLLHLRLAPSQPAGGTQIGWFANRTARGATSWNQQLTRLLAGFLYEFCTDAINARDPNRCQYCKYLMSMDSRFGIRNSLDFWRVRTAGAGRVFNPLRSIDLQDSLEHFRRLLLGLLSPSVAEITDCKKSRNASVEKQGEFRIQERHQRPA